MSVTMEDRTNTIARDERRALDQVIQSLSKRFPGTAPSTIERIVDRRYLEFFGAPIRQYIPTMVEREATADLRAQANIQPLHLRMSAS